MCFNTRDAYYVDNEITNEGTFSFIRLKSLGIQQNQMFHVMHMNWNASPFEQNCFFLVEFGVNLTHRMIRFKVRTRRLLHIINIFISCLVSFVLQLQITTTTATTKYLFQT